MVYPQSVVDFGRGDVLVLYTDGITEAEAPHARRQRRAGEMFGEEGLERVVREVVPAAGRRGSTRPSWPRCENHLAGDPAGDDITLVVISARWARRSSG